jgi:hypothetical protein
LKGYSRNKWINRVNKGSTRDIYGFEFNLVPRLFPLPLGEEQRAWVRGRIIGGKIFCENLKSKTML